MRIAIIILSLLIATSCFAEVKLFRYTDKISGDEMGICYSDKDGNPQVNPEWNVQEISESQKEYYIGEQQKQLKQKQQVAEQERKTRAKRVKDKLKELGISQEDLDEIIR